MKSTSTKIMKSLTLIVFFQFVLFVSMGFAAEDEKKVHFDFYYGVDYSKLDGSLSVWGIDLKDESVTSLGSKAGFKFSWGNAWLQRIVLDAYSTDSAFPSNFGRGDKELSLSSLAAFFGQNTGFLPILGFKRVEFLGIGVVNGKSPIFDQGRVMTKGEEFETGMTIDTFHLIWKGGNIGQIQLDKETAGPGYELGIGIARIELKGIKNSKIHQKIEGHGISFTGNLRYGTAPISESTNAYFQCNNDLTMDPDIGGMLKTGYEAGLLIRLGKKVAINPYVGGYFWMLKDWASDKNFDGISTNFGYSAGLQISAKF